MVKKINRVCNGQMIRQVVIKVNDKVAIEKDLFYANDNGKRQQV